MVSATQPARRVAYRIVCSGVYKQHWYGVLGDVCKRCGVKRTRSERNKWDLKQRRAIASEADIARAIDAFLDMGVRQGYWVYSAARQPNPRTPGKEGAGVGAMSKGQPDRLLFPIIRPRRKDYSAIAIEIKAADGKTSPEQEAWLTRFRVRPARVSLVVHSLDELQERLRELGVRCPDMTIEV